VPAASLFSGPYYFMEQLGFRKIIDSTFMMASLVTRDAGPLYARHGFAAPASPSGYMEIVNRDVYLRSC